MLRQEQTCDHEAALLNSLWSHTDDSELRAHADRCPVCRDTIAAAVWMRQFAAIPLDVPPLPSATHLWWKSQVLRRVHAERMATAPLDVGERTIVIGAMVLFVWLWRNWQPLAPSAAVPASIIAVMITSGLLLTIIAVVALHDLWRGNDLR